VQNLDPTEQPIHLGIREQCECADEQTRVARRLQIVQDRVGESKHLPVRDGDDPVGQTRAELVRRLRSRAPELWEVVFAHVRSTVPHAVADGDPALAAGLREMIEACLDCGLASIEQGPQWSGLVPPTVAAHARRAASNGVGLTTALCRCVAAYSQVWSFVLDDVAEHSPPGQQVFVLLQQVSAALVAVLAHVQVEIAEAQSAEIKHRSRSHEQRRAEIVRRLLEAEPVDAGELAELRYDLDAWHIAVIATGYGAEEAVRRLVAGLSCQLLQVLQGAGTVLAWLGSSRRLAFSDIARVCAEGGPWGASLAVGEAGSGIEGWRTTYREAQKALLVARDRPSEIVRYLDVALEAAALQDDTLADALIGKYLYPLEDVPIGGQAARRALRALFEAEHNVSSAANALGVHRSSIHRWRSQVERRLGYRLHQHQAEIELALRIEQMRKHQVSVLAG
jgi:hypothetical protein